MNELHDIFFWFAIGGLTWGGLLGIVVLFMMGAHRDD